MESQLASDRIRQKLEQFEFSKFDQFKSLDKVIFLVGTSRTGKSSLFLMLQDILVESKKMNDTTGPIILESSNQLYKNIIGHGKKAKTKMPNICEIPALQNGKNDNTTKYYIVDCPGLLDSEGFEDEFTNSYFVMKVFEIVKQARFLLCITQNQIKGGNMEPLVKSLSGFLKYFKKNTPNLDKIIEATSLVITQTLQFSPDGATVTDYLEDIKSNLQNKGLKDHATLFTNLVKSKRVYYEEKARTVAKQFSPTIGKQIKQKQAKNKFYQINKQEDIDFQFDCQANQQMAKQFDQMHAKVAKQLQQCCKILVQCFSQTIQNNSKEAKQKTHNFVDKIRKFVQVKDIYKSSKNLQGRKKKLQGIIEKVEFKQQQDDFAEIIYLRNINQAIVDYQDGQNPIHLQSLISSYLNNTMNNLYAGRDPNDIYNLAFIIKRNIEQLRIIEKIKKSVPKQYVSIHSAAQITQKFVLKQQEDKFIKTYKVRSQTTQEYLKYASDFFQTFSNKKIIDQVKKQIQTNQTGVKTIQTQVQNKNTQKTNKQKLNSELQSKIAQKPQNKVQIQKNNAEIQKIVNQITGFNAQITNLNKQINDITAQNKKRQQIERIRQKLLIDLKYQRARLQQSKSRWQQAYNQYQSCRAITQDFNKAQNSVNIYKLVNVKLYQSLGHICQEYLKNYELAIEYFRVIGHYLALKGAIKTYVQNTQFLAQIGQFKSAQELLWFACQNIQVDEKQQIQKIKTLKGKQLQIQKNKQNADKKYFQRIQNNDFFNRPNQKSIQMLKGKNK